MSHRRVEVSLPSQPLGNPKGKGPVFAVEDTGRIHQYGVSALRSSREEESTEERRARSPPFPRALEKPSSVVHDREVRMQDMLEMFRAVRINPSLLDAIRQVPTYARFLKELCTKKRRCRRIPESIMLSEETSSILLRRMPPKLEDPGTPIIQCIIGHIRVERALLDLGASVNVLSRYLYDAFQLEGLKPTSMTIQLTDRSVKAPRKVLEDVLLKIEDFVFPVDFMILDMEGVHADHQMPIILGRPFLATANACINCRTGVLEIPFGDQKLRMNIFHVAMGPAGDRCISFAEADDDDAGDAAREIIMSIVTSCIADPSPDFLPGTDISATCDSSSLGFHFKCVSDLDLGIDVFSHDQDSIVSSFDHSSQSDLVTSHSLSFEEREVDGGYDVLATTTLHRDRPHSNSIESLPPLALEPDYSSLESPSVMELKLLPHTLKYAYLDSDDSLPVIIPSVLSSYEENRLLVVLRGHKKAIGWKVADLREINPAFYMHRIHTLDSSKPTHEFQRQLNPAMKEVVKKEIIKWLDAGIIFPISDSEWVSPVQVVPKKSGLTVVKNEHWEEIPTKAQTGWRVCIDYRKLNAATQKDHFPLPFLDQVLEKLAGQSYYYFLDGYSGYNQVAVHPDDQEKTTFTCPFGTFAFRRMPFGLCNAPDTFQRCMLSIFSDMIEDMMEVFMDDFSRYGSSFDDCLQKLERVLIRCEETNLLFSWKKSHFMVREGIVLGHVVSERGIEVDKAKIETIAKLAPPSCVHEVRSFLGHAGFYRRFIKDFSKISRPLCDLLAKDLAFVFSKECQRSFLKLKEALSSVPILRASDWTLPFKIICDASNYAIGAILGQRVEKKPVVVYYASKMLVDAQMHYTTMKNELLAVVFALEKFRSYILRSKVLVYTDYAALKYLLSKKDVKLMLIRWILLLQEFDLEIRIKRAVRI
ncbi:unnamed protein product [Victoria cruziana]